MVAFSVRATGRSPDPRQAAQTCPQSWRQEGRKTQSPSARNVAARERGSPRAQELCVRPHKKHSTLPGWLSTEWEETERVPVQRAGPRGRGSSQGPDLAVPILSLGKG